MKNLMIIIVLVMFVNIANYALAEEKSQSIEIKTSAICEHCKENIEKALKKSDGVEQSNLDLSNKKVTVKYNPEKTNPDEIRITISKAGYNADDVKRELRAYKKLPKCCKE
jgi:copper chaperone CopZ